MQGEVVARLVENRPRLLGRLRARRDAGDGFTLFRFSVYADDSVRARRVDGEAPAGADGVRLLELRNRPFDVILPAMLRSAEGFDVSITLHARIAIVLQEEFIEQLAHAWLAENGTVGSERIGDHLLECSMAGLRAAGSALGYEQLCDAINHVSPELRDELARACAPHLRLESVRVGTLISEQGEAFLRDGTEHRAKRQRIELAEREAADAAAALERETQAAVQAAEAERARLRAEAELENERRRTELDRLRHEIERRKIELEAARQDEMADLAPRLEKFLAVLDAASSVHSEGVGELAAHHADLPADIVAGFAAADGTGFAQRNVVAALARRQLDGRTAPVTIRRDGTHSRDLAIRQGISGARTVVDQVVVGQALSFRVSSQQAGYLTLIVNASSGRSQLVAPNAFTGVEDCFVSDEEIVSFPGRALLRRDDIELYQQGPTGWEELIAIVSDEPLVTDADLVSALSDGGFARLDDAALGSFAARLLERQADSWAAAVLGYQVLDQS